MLQRPDPATTARDLIAELGLDGLFEAGRRAEECRRQSDPDGVRFWNAVGRYMRERDSVDGDAAKTGHRDAALAENARWRLMQRVEHFRHRAAQCRASAQRGAGASAQCDDMLEMERHWLELATCAELLAGDPKAP